MATNTIKARRGTYAEQAAISLEQSEFGYCTDTDHVFIGDGTNNHELLVLGVPMSENETISLNPVLSADTKWTGITKTVTAGTTGLVYGYCYYMASTGKWELTNATSIATCHGEVGMCVIAAATDATGTLLMYGMIRADDEFPTFTAGSDIFLSAATAGLLTQTAPTGTADYVVRIVAAAPTANSVSFKGEHAYVTLAGG